MFKEKPSAVIRNLIESIDMESHDLYMKGKALDEFKMKLLNLEIHFEKQEKHDDKNTTSPAESEEAHE